MQLSDAMRNFLAWLKSWLSWTKPIVVDPCPPTVEPPKIRAVVTQRRSAAQIISSAYIEIRSDESLSKDIEVQMILADMQRYLRYK